MKKVGQIFSVIGGVFAILAGVGVVISAILMLLLNIPNVKDAFMELMQKIAEASSLPIMDYANYVVAGATVSAIINLCFGILCFLAAGFSFVCHKKKNYIATIVISALAYFQIFAVLGAIFGLIFDNKKE